jgi:hypothetical protein
LHAGGLSWTSNAVRASFAEHVLSRLLFMPSLRKFQRPNAVFACKESEYLPPLSISGGLRALDKRRTVSAGIPCQLTTWRRCTS